MWPELQPPCVYKGVQPGPGAPGSISQGARSDVAWLEDKVLGDRGGGLQRHFCGGSQHFLVPTSSLWEGLVTGG